MAASSKALRGCARLLRLSLVTPLIHCIYTTASGTSIHCRQKCSAQLCKSGWPARCQLPAQQCLRSFLDLLSSLPPACMLQQLHHLKHSRQVHAASATCTSLPSLGHVAAIGAATLSLDFPYCWLLLLRCLCRGAGCLHPVHASLHSRRHEHVRRLGAGAPKQHRQVCNGVPLHQQPNAMSGAKQRNRAQKHTRADEHAIAHGGKHAVVHGAGHVLGISQAQALGVSCRLGSMTQPTTETAQLTLLFGTRLGPAW